MQNVTISSQTVGRAVRPSGRLRLGFVPLTDCAPLAVAQELGIFQRHGVAVSLSRELGWASVRDKMIYGELDAAHALGPMLFQLALGLTGNTCACFTPLILSAQGNTITLSRRLWNAGVRAAASLKAFRAGKRTPEPLTFGIVFPYSFHHLLLRDWLAAGGLAIDRDVKLVVVPPPQMVANLKAGHLDGFCAGEPWGSLAVETGTGHCVASSARLSPMHPEKALLVRQSVLDARPDEVVAITAALLDACAWCDVAANADQLSQLLAQPRYLGISRAAILKSLQPVPAPVGDGTRSMLFHGGDVNDPTLDKAGVMMSGLGRFGLLAQPVRAAQLQILFRSDLFQTAAQKPIQRVPAEIVTHHEIAFAAN